jgi:predicted negative regulator of RcsB-dependent stress response
LAEKKISRRDLLKEPDEFMTWTARTVQYFRDNPRQASTAVSVAFAVVLVVLAYYAYNQHQKSAAHDLFEKAYSDYQRTSLLPEAEQPQKWDKCLAAFEQTAANYGSLPQGELATLYSGHVLYNKGDYKAAAERYEKMQSTALAVKGLGNLATYHLAMTRMAMGDNEQAVLLFDKLTKNTSSPYRRESYASIAKIYLTTGKTKEALQAYKQYLKMFPQAPDAAFVRAKIAGLAGEES